MNLVQNIKPVSYVKSHAAEVMKRLGENDSPVVITQNGEAKAVLMDVGQYQDMVNALMLLKLLSIGEADIRSGRVYTHDEVKSRISSILEAE
jgi:prevent-host-death family protein